MPLYTYVLSFREATYVVQDRRSNYHGSAYALIAAVPDHALPGLTDQLRREAGDKALRSRWDALPNRAKVWRTSFDLGSKTFEMLAIQTDG